MPIRIRLFLALCLVTVVAVFYFILQNNWLAAAGFLLLCMLVLDVFYPQFDLEGFSLVRGNRNRKEVAITFDDGPSESVTPQILKILKNYGAKATFFVLGKHAEKFPEIIKAIVADGHEIGCHGYSHKKYTFQSRASIEKDILQWENGVSQYVNIEKPLSARPPHGFKHFGVRSVYKKLNYHLAAWTRGVWDTDQPGADVIAQRSLHRLKNGEILLLHDADGGLKHESRSQLIEALPKILEGLDRRGLKSVTLKTLRKHNPSKPIRWLKVYINSMVLLFLSLFVARSFDFDALKKSFLNMRFEWLAAGIFFDALCIYAKSQAWKNIIRPIKSIPGVKAFQIYLIGSMLNQILPLRGGDIGRSDMLAKNFDIPRWHGYSTILVEGMLYVLSIVPILLIAPIFAPFEKGLQHKLGIFMLVVLVVCGIFALLSKRFKHQFFEGFKIFKDKKVLLFSYLNFLVSWVFYILALICMMRAMNISTVFWAAPILGMLLAASVVIPAPPGRIGIFESTVVLALTMFAVPKEQSLSFAIVLHAAQALPLLAYGALAYYVYQKKS